VSAREARDTAARKGTAAREREAHERLSSKLFGPDSDDEEAEDIHEEGSLSTE